MSAPPQRSAAGRRPRDDDALGLYLAEIARTPLITADRERELAYRCAAGDPAARDELIQANLRLVVCVAKWYAGRGVGLDDLVAEGNFGLIHATGTFDPSYGLRFTTHASQWVKQYVSRAVDYHAELIRVPSHARNKLAAWERARTALESDAGAGAPAPAVDAALGLTGAEARMVACAAHSHAGTLADGAADELPDRQATPPEAKLTAADDTRLARELLALLDGRSAELLSMRYGLDGNPPRTLEQIGIALGVTRERVRQLELDAIERIRRHLRSKAARR